jgi:hypothetical protein
MRRHWCGWPELRAMMADFPGLLRLAKSKLSRASLTPRFTCVIGAATNSWGPSVVPIEVLDLLVRVVWIQLPKDQIEFFLLALVALTRLG